MSSTRRAIHIMDLLSRRGSLGVRAIALQLQLPVGSVHRIMSDLCQENVVERNADGSWQLSYRLLQINDRQLDNLRLPRLAHPFCEAIAEKAHETVNLNVLSFDKCVCIDKVRGNQGIQLDWGIGQPGPLYCGGSAKAILAFMSHADRERITRGRLVGFTEFTLTDPGALEAELADIRDRGYAIDNQEMVIGVFCVGVPIFDRLGRPVAAISISGPSRKAPGPQIAPLVALLENACAQVSKRLGYAGPWPPRDRIEAPPLEHAQ
jgi:DNA-binding IclR family transcriptional regulator